MTLIDRLRSPPRCDLRLVVLVALAVALNLSWQDSFAQTYQAGDVRIEQPFARPTPPGAKVAAAYFGALENRGAQPDRLMAASTPVADKVELHVGEIGADGVMRMREIEGIMLPPDVVRRLRPGAGEHLMLIGLARPLVAGETFPMTLEFERGGQLQVSVMVQQAGPGGMHAGEHKH